MASVNKPRQRLFDTEDLPIKRSNILTRLWSWMFDKHQITSRQNSFPEPVDLYLSILNKNNAPFTLSDIEDVSARFRYGPLVIKGYLFLLITQTVVPLTLWTAITWNNPITFSSGLRDLQDFVVAVSAGLTGISGLAGFVVGRYFRERAESR